MAANVRHNLLTGIFTVVPILVTIFVFSLFLELLSDIGRPKLTIIANAVRPLSPNLASWLLDSPWLSSTLAIALTLGMFYLLGWAMSRVVGRQILLNFEDWLNRIPGVTTIYGATKKLIEAFGSEGSRAQRVVLIEFPHARMKAIGLVTRTFIDEDTGEELAAVYVPTAPNPTGGYLEIVPVDELVLLDWSVDQAMTFVLSGGTTAPAHIRFSRRGGHPPESDSRMSPGTTGPKLAEEALAQPGHTTPRSAVSTPLL
jgi:uncharacterized membrane protein